jgi:hypothetical protein
MSQDNDQAVKEILDNLENETVELLDFDRLKEVLQECRSKARELKTVRSELQLLKEDYRGRLAGMLKALLACRYNACEAELAAMLADETSDLNVNELIRIYRNTAARFRQKFPSSFKYVAPSQSGVEHWREYKI